MRVLAFSDLHRDLEQAAVLSRMAEEADLVIAAGDFANAHAGLEEAIGALSGIGTPTLLVPGNNETEEALREAVSAWSAATVLHGDGVEIDGIEFFGLGGGIPTTPWDWSYDLDEGAAAEAISPCPFGGILVLHSPPKDACDTAGSGANLGSTALREAIEAKQPRLAVCGHIHEAWGARARIGATQVANLGPSGEYFEV
ncbi:MAG TPA: metallophosphoesterase family protein [Solirubrobacterales bacterium]|nr:metallophosphoesterase family protein [Solirubrobacterales bacterium]